MFVTNIYRKIDPFYLSTKRAGQSRVIEIPKYENEEDEADDLIVYYGEVFEDRQGRLFRIIDFIGKGSYSVVYKCEMVNLPGKFFAIKVSRNIARIQQRLENEAKVLEKLSAIEDSPGKKLVPEYVSIFPIKGHTCLTIGLYQRTLVERFSFEGDPSGLVLFIKCVMRQILDGLSLLHENGYVHGDLKPDNIMLVRDDGYDIKMIDFGSTTTIKNDMPRIPQALFYRSPEMMLGASWNEKIDIWAAGCIMAELCIGFPIFGCNTEEDAIGVITQLIGPVPQSIIVSSLYWKQYYAPTPRGLMLLRDPLKCFTEGHLYRDQFIDYEDPSFNLESVICSVFNGQIEKPQIDSILSFLYGLLEVDPSKRWSAQEALSHGFLSEKFSEKTINRNQKSRASYLACSSHVTIPFPYNIEPNEESILAPRSIPSALI